MKKPARARYLLLSAGAHGIAILRSRIVLSTTTQQYHREPHLQHSMENSICVVADQWISALKCNCWWGGHNTRGRLERLATLGSTLGVLGTWFILLLRVIDHGCFLLSCCHCPPHTIWRRFHCNAALSSHAFLLMAAVCV